MYNAACRDNFIPTPEQREKYAGRNAFINSIKGYENYEIRLGKLKRRTCDFCNHVKFEQKRVDVLMAVDLVKLSATHQISQAILVTGDSDFVPAVKVAKADGVLIQLYYSQITKSDELYDECDQRFEITRELIEKSALR